MKMIFPDRNEGTDRLQSASRPHAKRRTSGKNAKCARLELRPARIATKVTDHRDDSGYFEVLKQRAYDPTTDAGHIGQYSIEILERLRRANGFRSLGYETIALGASPFPRFFPDTIVMIAKKVAQND